MTAAALPRPEMPPVLDGHGHCMCLDDWGSGPLPSCAIEPIADALGVPGLLRRSRHLAESRGSSGLWLAMAAWSIRRGRGLYHLLMPSAESMAAARAEAALVRELSLLGLVKAVEAACPYTGPVSADGRPATAGLSVQGRSLPARVATPGEPHSAKSRGVVLMPVSA